MRLTLTTTYEDEVEDMFELVIPDDLHSLVTGLAGFDENARGIQEVSLETAAAIAEQFFLDIGEYEGVRCWLHL